MSKNINEIRKKKLEQQKKEARFYLLINCVVIAIISVFLYFFAYKPEEKKFIRLSKSTYEILQKELSEYHKINNKRVYPKEQEAFDGFCVHLANKLGIDGNCNISSIASESANIVLENNVEIYGFDRPANKSSGSLAKDIMIDVNGLKGKNEVGIDRLLLRINSHDGILVPINCHKMYEEDYEMTMSPYCPAGSLINFLTSNKPLSFNVFQVDENGATLKSIASNVSYIRADCLAFGGEMLGYIEYCDKKGYYWIKSCYYDYDCEIRLNK